MPLITSCPAGVCIQLLAARIQKAESEVPTATSTADSHVQVRRHAVPAEQHDAEEGRLEEERGQHLVAEQRPEHVADDDREVAPVGAELVGQHDAGDDAHGEGHGEDLGPEARQAMQVLAPGHPPAHEQRRDEGREPDREAREDDVEGDREARTGSGPAERRRIPWHPLRFLLSIARRALWRGSATASRQPAAAPGLA